MNHIILGGGEVGSAYARLLRAAGESVFVEDKDPSRSDNFAKPESVDILHVCLRYSDEFLSIVAYAVEHYRPRLVNNMATCPPGTTALIGPNAVHSTTRGLHPALDEAIRLTPKHYGGAQAKAVSEAFIGVCVEPPVLHANARTTELCHLASNFQYAVNIMAADEIEAWCRAYSVDYLDFIAYTQTHNKGYSALGMPSKLRSVVYPSGGKIGGHCVKLSASLIPEKLQGPLVKRISEYA